MANKEQPTIDNKMMTEEVANKSTITVTLLRDTYWNDKTYEAGEQIEILPEQKADFAWLIACPDCPQGCTTCTTCL